MFNSKKGIEDKVSNKLTTLSSQSLIKGDCSIDGDMRIDGTVEGNIHGNLSCTHACLHGTIIGDAYVKEELTLKANCVMQGNIYTTKLEIESQAKFNGTCNTNDTNHEIKLLEAVTE